MHFRLPTWCYECQQLILTADRSPTFLLCRQCYHEIPFKSESGCDKCGLPHLTASCDEKWALQISRFQALFEYKEAIARWISSLKYSRSFIAGKILLHFLDKWFAENQAYLNTFDLIIPVPVHPLRLRRRGFNQTRFLLKHQSDRIAKLSLLKRTRQTPHQAGLSRRQRKKNLKSAFEVSANLKGKRVLVFDDVCTTGQTLGEVAFCLKQAQADRIDVLVLGRAY